MTKNGMNILTEAETSLVSCTATVVEIYVGIIGACLPTLVPVYRKLRYGDPHKSHANLIPRDPPHKVGRNARPKKLSNGGGSSERLNNNEDALTPSIYLRDYQVSVGGTAGIMIPAYTEVGTYHLDGKVVRDHSRVANLGGWGR